MNAAPRELAQQGRGGCFPPRSPVSPAGTHLPRTVWVLRASAKSSEDLCASPGPDPGSLSVSSQDPPGLYGLQAPFPAGVLLRGP